MPGWSRPEDAPLAAEAIQDELRVHAPTDELQRDRLVKPVARARGEVDGSHAAVAELALDLPGSDPRRRLRRRRRRADLLEGRPLEEFTGRPMRLEQTLDLGVQLGVVAARLREERRAVRLRPLQCAVEEVLDLPPALRRHGRPSSRKSHARADRNSRLIDDADVSIASAVSSIDRPPKNRSSTIRA